MVSILKNSRFLVIIAVLITSVSALLLYGASINILVHILLDYVQEIPKTAGSGKSLAVKLLKLLDLLLISITLQLMAVGLYRLFITPFQLEDSKFLTSMKIKNFHDLKKTLAQVAAVIILILFLEQAVETGATLETLYFGAAVAFVITAAVFAWKNMK